MTLSALGFMSLPASGCLYLPSLMILTGVVLTSICCSSSLTNSLLLFMRVACIASCFSGTRWMMMFRRFSPFTSSIFCSDTASLKTVLGLVLV